LTGVTYFFTSGGCNTESGSPASIAVGEERSLNIYPAPEAAGENIFLAE